MKDIDPITAGRNREALEELYNEIHGDDVINTVLKKMGSRDIFDSMELERRSLCRRMAYKWMVAAGIREAATDASSAVSRYILTIAIV